MKMYRFSFKGLFKKGYLYKVAVGKTEIRLNFDVNLRPLHNDFRLLLPLLIDTTLLL